MLLRLSVLLLVAVLGILHIVAHYACAHVLSHVHTHKADSRAAGVVASAADTFSDALCHVCLLVCGVLEVADLRSHLAALGNNLLAFFVVSRGLHTYRGNLEASELVPVLVKGVSHVLAHFLCL